MSLRSDVLHNGRDCPGSGLLRLEAGPLAVSIDETSGFVRYIRYEGVEIVRGIYVALRDRNWDTVPQRLLRTRVERTSETFTAQFDFECMQDEIDFLWTGSVAGFSDGTLTYRVGWCHIFHRAEKSTAPHWVVLAREVLGGLMPEVPLGIGTDAYFTELNRDRPPAGSADFISYSINPQVHAFDNLSLVETLPVQASTVESARKFAGSADIAISSITLKPRFNPNATEPEAGPLAGQLPPQVDPRQRSLFGAVWTLGSLKYLSEVGPRSLTYYETCGWRGVIQGSHAPPLPQQFPAEAGDAFPLYHVLADIGELSGAKVLRSISSDPLRVVGLAIRKEVEVCIVLANLDHRSHVVFVDYPQLPSRVDVRYLDETNAEKAVRDPDGFRKASGVHLSPDQGRLRVSLLPFGIARIRGRQESHVGRADRRNI